MKMETKNNKPYKPHIISNINMIPGDLQGSPDESFSEETLVFIDEAFLSKISKYFGRGKYLKFDRINFAKNISKKQNLICLHVFLFTAPPFQCENPSKDEEQRKKGYDNFINNFSGNKEITVREGRCQRIKNKESEFIFKQKAVDILLTIDLMRVPLRYPNLKKIILVSSDSDFVPVIEALKEFDIKIILYTYYERKRNSIFSTSNELIKLVHKYIQSNKEDFDSSPLNKDNKKLIK